jgi:hypothetical protein
VFWVLGEIKKGEAIDGNTQPSWRNIHKIDHGGEGTALRVSRPERLDPYNLQSFTLTPASGWHLVWEQGPSSVGTFFC